MDTRKSSESFIKALKGKESSESKIKLATDGWHSKTLYLPGKHSVIADWLIQALCEGSSDLRASSSEDIRYWRLLAEIISSQDPKSTNTWLTTILARRAILPVFTAIISELSELPDVAPYFAVVYRHILPLVVPKASDEFLLRCLWAPLDAISKEPHHTPEAAVADIWTLGLDSFRTRFSQIKEKRNVISGFLNERIAKWAGAIRFTTLPMNLRIALRSAGEVLLFGSADGLLFSMELPTNTPSTSISLSTNLNSFFISLKESTESDPSNALLQAFPTFLQFFTKAIQRSNIDISQVLNRDVPSETRARVAIVHFTNQCLLGPLAFSPSDIDDNRSIMETRLQLLRMVEEERYLDTDNPDIKYLVIREMEFALGVLQRDDTREAALEVMTLFLKVDFDLINPVLCRILTTASMLPSESFSCCEAFLSRLLGVHSKTRTIPAHIQALVECVLSASAEHLIAVNCGPLFASPTYLKELQQAIRLFLTPTQVPQVARLLIISFKTLWSLLKLPDTQGTDDMNTDSTFTPLPNSIDPQTALILLTRLMITIFSALPTLDAATQVEFQRLYDGYLGIATLRQLVSGMERASAHAQSSEAQTGAQVNMQLRYCLARLGGDWGLELDEDSSAVVDALLSALRLQRLQPQPLLNVAMAALYTASLSLAPAGPSVEVISLIIDRIEENVNAAYQDQDGWDGQSAKLASPSHAAIALLDLLLGRWLHVLELKASEESLERLGRLLLSLPSAASENHAGDSRKTSKSPDAKRIHPVDLVWNAFASAEFWEMRRLRVALTTVAVEITAELDQLEPEMSATGRKLKRADAHSLKRQIACYRSMLYWPQEYFTRAAKPLLANRALILDRIIINFNVNPSANDLEQIFEWATTARTFVDRSIASESLVKTRGVLLHLVDSAAKLAELRSSSPTAFEKVTLQLLWKAFNALAATATNQDVNSVKSMLEQYMQGTSPFVAQNEAMATNNIRVQSCFDLLNAFIKETSYSELDFRLQGCLDSAHTSIESWSKLQFDRNLGTIVKKDAESIVKARLAVDGWRTSSKYKRWKNPADTPTHTLFVNPLSLLPRFFVQRPLDTNPETAELGLAVFRFLLEEIQGSDGVESIVAGFVFLYPFGLLASLTKDLSASVKRWSTDQYATAVTLIINYYRQSTAGKTPVASTNLAALFSLSSTLIIDSPEATGKHAHILLQQTLVAMLQSSQLRGPPSSEWFLEYVAHTNEALLFLQSICSEKSSFLRDIEVGHIFTILHTALSPFSVVGEGQSSTKPGIISSSNLYAAIANTLISLVRNQRDLVRTHLPDFTKLLCLLVASLKTVHQAPTSKLEVPGLSASKISSKSLEVVQSSLPWWVSVSDEHPELKLSEQDARQLNRLLMSINAKNLSKDPQSRRPRGPERVLKADSLASSFSNYATFVLIAYVRTVTDSYHARSGGLTTLSKPVRRELEEGISGLCGMIGDNRRDCVYQSLTSDGRSLFKGIWARYEKHRYSGTG